MKRCSSQSSRQRLPHRRPHHDRYEHLTTSIDGAWADVLWEYEKADGSDFVIDDEFMRYLTFVIDVCEWRDGAAGPPLAGQGSLSGVADRGARPTCVRGRRQRARRAGTVTSSSMRSTRGRASTPPHEFSKLFTAGGAGEGPLPLLVSTSPDLFGSCISQVRPGARFSLAETLMLFAVLLARQAGGLEPADRDRRLRTLRNLAESAFIDRKRMAEYVGTVERLMLQGTLDGAQAFNAEWTADEQTKWKRRRRAP